MVTKPEQEKIAEYEKLRNGGSVVRFWQLPLEAKAALAWYMAFDGCAWKLPQYLEKEFTVNDFVDVVRKGGFNRYMDFQIGFHPGISVKDLKKSMMQDSDIENEHEDFNQYHEWYLNVACPVDHDVTKPLWPVILGDLQTDYFETLQDGWHRFHCYVRNGIQKIPALYFLGENE